jgi:hypothetical protein
MMRGLHSSTQPNWYFFACVISMGVAFGIRILMSEAIRQAIKSDEENKK